MEGEGRRDIFQLGTHSQRRNPQAGKKITTTVVFTQKQGVSPHIQSPQHGSLALENEPPKHLALKTTKTWIVENQRAQETQISLLKGHANLLKLQRRRRQQFETLRVNPVVTQSIKNSPVMQRLPAMQETWVGSLGWENLLEKEMTTLSQYSCLGSPWTKEPGGQQFIGLQSLI